MLTLITATLNAGAFLERAVASALAQEGAVQHIVVDGGSSDDTVAVCRRHPDVDLVVAPGCSIYEAWNIGVDRAQGDAIMFLNADDELLPDTVAQVDRAYRSNPQADIVAGRAAFVDSDRPEMNLPILRAAPSGALDVAQLAMGVPVINAMVFKPSVFERFGRFELVYRVAGDRAFLLRLALSAEPPRVASTDAVLYRYYIHAGSLTLRRSLTQRLRVARDHVALARAMLQGSVPESEAVWLRQMRRREATVASLRCLAAMRIAEIGPFAKAIFR